MNKRTDRTSRTKEIDGFLCCKIKTETEKPKQQKKHQEFPEELEDFLRGLNGKKQH